MRRPHHGIRLHWNKAMAKKKPAKKTGAKTARKKKAKRNKRTTDGLAIIDRRFFSGQPKQQALLEQARADDEVARKIYKLRNKSGLTQRELAGLVGTTASVICRLEDADYDGHSLAMLRRIAAALNKRVEIRFVSLGGKAQPA